MKYPGVGCRDSMEVPQKHHDALVEVQLRLQELAAEFGIEFPYGYPGIATLRKDLETLRKYGILERRMYRWGYYLGTGAMSSQEFKVALNALFTQAKFQGDPQARRICDHLSRRLRGLDIESKGELFYPVRQYLNRVIVYTDPEEMASLGKNRNNLFHQLSVVEKAISQGQLIEILRSSDPYKNNRIGAIQVYPLQLIYHDIAWYLLYEYSSGHNTTRLRHFYRIYPPLPPLNKGGKERFLAPLNKGGWGDQFLNRAVLVVDISPLVELTALQTTAKLLIHQVEVSTHNAQV